MISKRKLYDQNILSVHGNSQIEDIGMYIIRFSPSLNNIMLNNEEYSMSNVTKYLNNDNMYMYINSLSTVLGYNMKTLEKNINGVVNGKIISFHTTIFHFLSTLAVMMIKKKLTLTILRF